MFYQIDTLFVRNRTTVLRRRVARNSQLGAVLGGGGASSRRRHGVWGRNPQSSKILYFFAEITSFLGYFD